MKLGIFGGTFDPIHNAHLFIAEAARTLEGLDKIIFVPTNRTHYRDGATATARDRCSMIATSIASNPAFGLDESDLHDDASGYTADLLPRLQQRYPDAGLTFIIGADSLASNQWIRLEEVLEALEYLVIAPRAGVSADALTRAVAAIPKHLRDRVRTLNLPETPESATLIRKLLADQKSVRYLVPEPAWRYITEHHLYEGRGQ
ncbi:MAG: nicotinate (nicotinamide) nucleotide adenylyltransferase [Candidatus Baltobacteraceae bacterium]